MYMYNDSRKTFATRDVGSPNLQHLRTPRTARHSATRDVFEQAHRAHRIRRRAGGARRSRLDRVSIAQRVSFRSRDSRQLVLDFSLRQAAGAFYGPSALEVYTAEASLATAERKLAAVKALARDDEASFAKARTRWSALKSAFQEASERYRSTAESLDARKVALALAKKAYEDTERELYEAERARAEAEKDEAEANLTLARARQKLGTHDEAIAQAKVEVQKLTTVAEAAIKKMNALKLPTF